MRIALAIAVSDGFIDPDADEETRVHDVEIVELVRFAVPIQHRGLCIAANAAGSGLVFLP